MSIVFGELAVRHGSPFCSKGGYVGDNGILASQYVDSKLHAKCGNISQIGDMLEGLVNVNLALNGCTMY